MAKAREGVAITGPMSEALKACRDLVVSSVAFGAGVNLLYLAPSIFMMQVYDRVLLTGGLATLGFISVALVFALGTLGFLDAMRSRLMTRIGMRLDRLVVPSLLGAALGQDQHTDDTFRLQILRNFDGFRQAISGPAATAIVDAPWALIYVLVCTMIHPLLGLTVAFGGGALFLVALASERAQRRAIAQAGDAAPRLYAAQDSDSASAPTVRALGMSSVLVERQLAARASLNTLQTKSILTAISYSSGTKFLRLLLQSVILGIGAWLAIDRQISPGAMIAASILSSRALGPLEQIVASWRTIGQAQRAYGAIVEALTNAAGVQTRTTLPAPSGALQVERVSVRIPHANTLALSDISFSIAPGEILGVIGPSGAGKSTLARACAGAITPYSGTVRLDTANFMDWDPDIRGSHIGYVPQETHLLAGTIAENIRRFVERSEESAADLDLLTVEAAQAAGAHEMILRLPEGYDTPLGLGGAGLSLGQAQRVALARALFRAPPLLVLDEPNAHVDADGETALVNALVTAKARGAAILLVAHRAGVLALADRLLVMMDGRMQALGPREEVARRTAAAPEVRTKVPAVALREAHS